MLDDLITQHRLFDKDQFVAAPVTERHLKEQASPSFFTRYKVRIRDIFFP